MHPTAPKTPGRRSSTLIALFLLAATIAISCGTETAPPGPPPEDADVSPSEGRSAEMYVAAETFVKLVLALGEHDADYVDAYFGPEEWRAEAKSSALSLEDIRGQAADVAVELAGLDLREGSDGSRRRANLDKSLTALIARADILTGSGLSFDEESAALYDAVAPTHTAEEFQAVLDDLDAALPGTGPITDRFNEFRSGFVIPPDKLDSVFAAAVDACRSKTLEHLALPEGESFEIEYVTDKSWSGYNWYKGEYHSLIQVNTDLPIYIDRALDLACHEGYPGHHVYNVLLERELVNGKGWVEYTVYPLFSPRSLLAEGTANFGIEVAFPADERIAFERETLFPLAGLDPAGAESYYAIQKLMSSLSFAGNEAARRYLDGDFTKEQAVSWLVDYSLMSPERAAQRLRFIEQYRSYVINYNLGLELVREWVERRGGTSEESERRWTEFSRLLTEPWLPSELE